MDEWSGADGTGADAARPLRLRAKLAVAGIVVYTALYVVLGAIVVRRRARRRST